MGYKFPRTPCAICAQNKSVRAASNKTPAPKGKRPLDFVHIDIKVANTPDRHGNTLKLGIVDTCTQKSWVYTLRDGKASTVIAALKQWQVQDLHNRPVGKIMFDNDSAFVSQEMTDYLNSCTPPIPRVFSCAYHQHQNGVAEALWARLTPLVRIFIQSAHWLGTDF
jgi:hypothetical protein